MVNWRSAPGAYGDPGLCAVRRFHRSLHGVAYDVQQRLNQLAPVCENIGNARVVIPPQASVSPWFSAIDQAETRSVISWIFNG